MNQADIAVSNMLVELGISSEESKEKICLIEDLVKVGRLMGYPSPTVEDFDMLYDSTLPELELMQEIVVQEQQLGLFTKLFYHR